MTVSDYQQSWKDFKNLISQGYTSNFTRIFRGQRDSSWPLISSLTRLYKDVAPGMPASNFEDMMSEKFKMAIRGLRGPNPTLLDKEGLFSLGQHYGLATPLIDWTASPFIAAYFAFELSKKPSTGHRAIWMLDRSILAESCVEDLQLVEPLQEDNKRIIAQSGLFTRIPTGKSLEDILFENDILEKCLIKCTIPDDDRLEVLNDLRLMNIGASTLYPDLIGAAKGCNMWVENYHDNKKRNDWALEIIKK